MRDKLREEIAYQVYLYRLSISDEETTDMWKTFTPTIKLMWYQVADKILNIDIIKQAIENAERGDK